MALYYLFILWSFPLFIFFQLALDTHTNLGHLTEQKDKLLARIQDLLSWLQDCQQRLDECSNCNLTDEDIIHELGDCKVSADVNWKKINPKNIMFSLLNSNGLFLLNRKPKLLILLKSTIDLCVNSIMPAYLFITIICNSLFYCKDTQ